MTAKIDKTRYCYAVREITKNEFEEIQHNGMSTLTSGKGKSKRFFVTLYSNIGHSSGFEMVLKSRGYTGKFLIMEHVGKKTNPEILREFEI